MACPLLEIRNVLKQSISFCIPSHSVCHPHQFFYMSSCPPPQWHSPTQLSHGRISCRRNGFFHSFNSISGIGISLGSFLLVGLIFYMTFLLPHGGPLLLSSSEWPTPENHTFSSPSNSDILSLEQIRDIVTPTRGFLSRDYSLYLGWNNVSICDNPIRAEADNYRIDAIYSRCSTSPSKFT